MTRVALVFLVLLPMLAACGGGRGDDAQPGSNFLTLYSPNGEPLSGGPLGHPTCPEALSAWFDRLDPQHTGAIDLASFLDDARRQFAAMDLDHDGFITPDELAQYRAKYGAGSRVAAALDEGEQQSDEAPWERQTHTDEEDVSHPRIPGGGGGGSGTRGLGQDRADPVMIADVHLRQRVSLDDFLAYERENFAELDTNHDKHVSKAELLRSCPRQ